MKNSHIRNTIFISMIIFLAIIALMLPLSPHDDEIQPTSNVLDDPRQIYKEAIGHYDIQNITYRIETKTEIVINDEIFHENTTQLVTMEQNNETGNNFAVEESICIGEHTVTISEIFHKGIIYSTVSGAKFRSEIKEDEYLARIAPFILINPELYAEVSGYKKEECSIIKFSSATEPEQWISDQETILKDAEGMTKISANGELLENTYNANYEISGTRIQLSVKTTPADNERQINVPDDPESYTKIANPDTPVLLEKACGYVTSAKSICSKYTDYIECTAFEDRRQQTIEVDIDGNSDWSSRIQTSLQYSDHSKAGSNTVIEKEELFANGAYSIQIDGGTIYNDDTVTQEMMRSFCQNILIGTIMLPEHISDAEIMISDSAYYITYTANTEFAEQIRSRACETLYDDPDILIDQTVSYRVEKAMCYLHIDKTTGLPLASGFHYIGAFTIDTLPYRLVFRADQEYQMLNDHAVESINIALCA